LDKRSRRNVAILSIALALGMSGGVLAISTSGMVGAMLHPQAAFATVPLAFLFGGTMLSTLPAALLMARIGRRWGSLLGAASGVTAACICTVAIVAGSFWTFCIGLLLYGSANAFMQQYRFAAAEAVPAPLRGTAISLVMAGGLAAAVIGPNLASWSRELFADAPFAGCFLVLAGLQGSIALVLWFLDIPVRKPEEPSAPRRPLREIVQQPKFVVALAAAALAYAVMNYFMTSTPLAVVGHGHGFAEAMFVVEWHVLGMYAPAFVIAPLIKLYGPVAVMAVGVLSYTASIVAAASGTALLANFWASSVLLGVGWSFCFIGATALLTETHRCSEAGRVQGVNDLVVFSLVAAASMAGGWIYGFHGWHMLTICAGPAVLALVLAIGWLALHGAARRRRSPAPRASGRRVQNVEAPAFAQHPFPSRLTQEIVR
jgi:MFS family permease